MGITVEDVKAALTAVIDPNTQKDFVSSKSVKNIKLDGAKHWGNSLGVRLPAAIARAANLHVDQKVRISVEDGRVVIEPERRSYPTLGERLAAYDIARHGGEVMVTPSVGKEF